MRSVECGVVSGTGYLTVFAFAGQVWHRCEINRESTRTVARDLGFDRSVVSGLLRLLRSLGGVPPAARLALCAMHDPGATDADISDAFGIPLEDVAWIRSHEREVRAADPCCMSLEFIEVDPTDPTPEEISERCQLIERRPGGWEPRTPGIRNYRNDTRASLVSQLVN